MYKLTYFIVIDFIKKRLKKTSALSYDIMISYDS